MGSIGSMALHNPIALARIELTGVANCSPF
jgi:hypothetical protein